MSSNPVVSGGLEPAVTDLGPLAWVLDELRKSLDGASKALKRFVRDAELARGTDLSELDASPLRIARQQLHQAVGALEMVGLEAPATVLRAMEALTQKFVQHPELCSDGAAGKVERASFALTQYLEGVLKGKMASPVALFPQYRAVLDLVGGESAHPADLWPLKWRWLDIGLQSDAPALTYAPSLRVQMDQAVLKVMKIGDVVAASGVGKLCVGLAKGQSALESRTFWTICAAYFEALALGLSPGDIYTKRAASRILRQYATLAQGDPSISERLARDLVFFCSLAVPAEGQYAPALKAVRAAYGLALANAVDYETEQFGRFDPALMVLARKRIAAAAETWSALAGGDTNRLKVVSEQFSAVSDSVVKLHPESDDLARALLRAVEVTSQSAAAPVPAVAMEVATTVLYLESAYEDLDPTDSKMAERGVRLAQRLEHVIQGGQPEPMEAWMEDLYRRVSERQTMGSVVGELRTNLGEVEKSLDQFFRDPSDKGPLNELPGKLAQMRGVFSVLGLDQPSIAAMRMRASVEQFLVDDIDEATTRADIFEKLGNSLGAMGFLIDMLGYQRSLAKTLFVYDEALGALKPVMGSERAPAPVPVPVPIPAVDEPDDEDVELKDIFLDEARDVVRNGLVAAKALAVDPSDLAEQATLRRAFHTLKGSSRMVGLNAFGEAAWSFEQLLNTWLAEQRPASDDLITASLAAMQAFGRWVEDISNGTDAQWSAQDFRKSSDGLRLNNGLVPLRTPDAAPADAEPDFPHVDFSETQAFNFDATDIAGTHKQDEPAAEAPSIKGIDLEDFDFGDMEPWATAKPEEPDVAPSEVLDEATVASEALAVPAGEPEAFAEAEVLDALTATPVDASLQHLEFPPVEMPAEVDDQVKVIGDLRLSIPLYNVYLNEADEWSRRLQTEVSEWAIELSLPLPDSLVSLAHSLLGCSATVGFSALSNMARALEHALQHVQLHHQGTPEQAQVFTNAAEDIRRLLHQFAAGFLKESDASVLEALQQIIETEFPAPTMESQPGDLGEEDAVLALPEEAEVESTLDTAPDESVAEITEPVERAELAAPSAPAAPLHVASAEDEEIDAVDTLDEDLLPIFEEEAAELIPHLGAALRQWVARPDNLSARGEVLRVLHTLKGSARLAGAMRLGEMVHRMESDIEQIGSESLQSVQLEPLLTRFDALEACFVALSAAPAIDDTPVEVAAADVSLNAPALKILPAASGAVLVPRKSGNQTVRVRSQLLDRLVNQAGEVMMSRARMDARLIQLRLSLGELGGNLERLRQQLRDVELQAESQMQSRLAQTRDAAQAFDPLEFDRFTRVQELTRMMAESVNDVATVQRNLQRSVEGAEDDLVAQGRQARELQRDLLRTRMVEFDSISERLYGVVRQASKDSGKQVKLDITGGSIEMDRGVLERMAPAFEHLLRNAVAHGIEDAATRVSAEKPVAGTITIHVNQESNDVSVAFSDDGGGLHLEKIRAKAIANGVLGGGDLLSESDAANLLFAPGFSTAEQITELSGRGIGMDVVRSEVSSLGGRIETHTSEQGTTFKLVLPLTTAVTQVVMLRMGAVTIGVPSSLVETILRTPKALLEASYQSHRFDVGGQTVPFFWGGALLQVSARSDEVQAKTQSVAIFRSAGQRLAMQVDEVLGNREVVVKNLGPQLARLPGLAGVSVLASGAIALIYNPVALASVYGDRARQLNAATGDAQPVQTQMGGVNPVPLVLVVDDSITVRRVTQRLLKREGYRVALASDGLQALERLQEETPSVVLSDIEMPRMDGFDLVRNIRRDAALRDLPIIMITSRIAAKHRDHAMALGVDHYLGKPYSEDELLGLVRSYCDKSVEA